MKKTYNDPRITYFKGTVAQAILRPLHFAEIGHAEANSDHNDFSGQHLFVYKDEELILVIDINALWVRWITKLPKQVLRMVGQNTIKRWVRCAVYRALKS